MAAATVNRAASTNHGSAGVEPGGGALAWAGQRGTSIPAGSFVHKNVCVGAGEKSLPGASLAKVCACGMMNVLNRGGALHSCIESLLALPPDYVFNNPQTTIYVQTLK